MMNHKHHPRVVKIKSVKYKSVWMMSRTRWHRQLFFFFFLLPPSSPLIPRTLFSHTTWHHHSQKSLLCSSSRPAACQPQPQYPPTPMFTVQASQNLPTPTFYDDLNCPGWAKIIRCILVCFGFVFNVLNRELMFFWFDIRVTVPGDDHFWYVWFLPVRYAMLLPSCHRLCPHQVLFLRVPPLNVLVRFFVKKGGKGL